MTIKGVSIEPGWELWYHAHFSLGDAIEVGSTLAGWRRVVPITGGTFEGARLSGKVLPGGSDWQCLRSDGALEVEARYALETRDGARIRVENVGILRGPPDVMARLAEGEVPSPDQYYFRTVPHFETAHPDYAWLQRQIAIAVAEVQRGGVLLSVYGVR